MERKHSCERKPLRRFSWPAVALLALSLSACEPQQEAERDRELDRYAASFVLGQGPLGEAVDEARKSIRYHRDKGDLFAARGVALSHLAWIEEEPPSDSSELAEFSRILAELDREISRLTEDEIRTKIAASSRTGFNTANIAYQYEIYSRARPGLEQARVAAEMCGSMIFNLNQIAPEDGDPRVGKAFEYCEEAFTVLSDSGSAEDMQPMRRSFSALGSLWRISDRPPLAFPYTEKILPHLSHKEIEQQLESLSYAFAALVLSHRSDMAAVEDAARVSAHLRFISAKELGNEKEMGLARMSQGASLERQGKYDEAAKSYSDAEKLLNSVGYLAVNTPLATSLRDFDSEKTEADLRAATTIAEANQDHAGEAAAHEALALMLSRQEKPSEAGNAHFSMLEAARQAGEKHLLAKALFLSSSQSGSIGGPAERIERLSEAAHLYSELGDADGEAGALLVLSGLDHGNLAAHQARAFSLLPSVGDPRLKALLHQMKALQDQAGGDFASMKESGAQCRDHWASLGAREQVAHCEVLLAEAERQLESNERSCSHLATARDIYVGLGMPGKTALQERKMAQQGCAAP